MFTTAFLIQLAIMLTGAVAIFLTQQSNEKLKRYACFFGVVGEPFWIYTAYVNGQWGVLVLAIFYTYTWLLGVYNNWFKKK